MARSLREDTDTDYAYRSPEGNLYLMKEFITQPTEEDGLILWEGDCNGTYVWCVARFEIVPVQKRYRRQKDEE